MASELDWLQVYDMTHWWKIALRAGASLQKLQPPKFSDSSRDVWAPPLYKYQIR